MHLFGSVSRFFQQAFQAISMMPRVKGPFNLQPLFQKVQKRGSRKVVLQTRIFFSGQPLFSNLKKRQIYGIKPPFFWSTTFLEPDFSNQISQTTFLKPLFYTFLEKWLQIKVSNELLIRRFYESRVYQSHLFFLPNLLLVWISSKYSSFFFNLHLSTTVLIFTPCTM